MSHKSDKLPSGTLSEVENEAGDLRNALQVFEKRLILDALKQNH